MTVVAEYVTKDHFDIAMDRIDRTFVTKDHFDRAMTRIDTQFVTKDHFDSTLERYVTKEHFDRTLALYVTKQHFDRTLALYVTKEHFDRTLALYVTKEYFDSAMDYIDKRFEVVIEMLTNLTQIVQDDKRRIGILENDRENVKETLSDLSEAEGKDALATINHERRIIRLEKRLKIIPDTPFHLLQPE